MCECGCSQGPTYFFPGPKGITYGIELYRGCRDCGNPPDVTLTRIPDADLWDFGPADRRKPVPWSDSFVGERFVAQMVDRDLLKAEIKANEDGDLYPFSDEDGELTDEQAGAIAAAAWRALLEVAFETPADSISESPTRGGSEA